MSGGLWIDRYRPSVSDLPQPDLRTYLAEVSEGPVNLILHGPAGSGKTAAVHALAEELHKDSQNDLMTINVADFFGMTKREIAEDPRFAGFIGADQRKASKASMINHVLTEMASYPPVSGSFKTILLDNAEAMREDFQQALRRVMERHYAATQFVFTTRHPGAILLPIRSRCAQIPVRAPTNDEIVAVLTDIVDREGVDADREGLEYLAGYAEGNLRKAILAAQTTAEDAGEITMETAYEALEDVGRDERIEAALQRAEAGEFSDARKLLDEFLIDDGYDGTDLLAEFVRVARNRYEPETVAAVAALAGEIDFDMAQGANDRVHLAHFLSRLDPSARTVPVRAD